MLILLSIEAALLFGTFVMHFAPAYKVADVDIMYFKGVFDAGTSSFAFFMNVILLTFVLVALFYELSKEDADGRLLFAFVGFFSLINTILHFVVASKIEDDVPVILIFIIIFSVITTLYSIIASIVLFIEDKNQFAFTYHQTLVAKGAADDLHIGDEVLTKKNKQLGEVTYPKGTIGKIIDVDRFSVILLVNEGQKNQNKILFLRNDIEKHTESAN